MPPTLAEADAPRALDACIIAIGDELVTGEKLDTNSRAIARHLGERGWRVRTHETVGDDRAQIERAIRDGARRASLVLATGGLGPTLDDLTREALGAVMGEALVEDAPTMERLRRWSERRGIELTPGQRSQALRPASASCLANESGTAPGLLARVGTATIACLPGPPGEMRPMLDEVTRLATPPGAGRPAGVRLLHVHAMGEGTIGHRLEDLMRRGQEPEVGTTASGGIVTCRVRTRGAGPDAQRRSDEVCAEIRRRLDPFVFGEGDTTLAGACIDLLRTRGERLVVVESCTGGLLGGAVTGVAGSSNIFDGGWITYANEMKRAQVGVDEQALRRHGAVSEQTALQMARGALDAWSRADHALAITGIAGPDGGSEEKPVGTVFIAHAQRDSARARRFALPGQREQVRARAVTCALGVLRLALVTGADDVSMLWEVPARARSEGDA